MYEAGLLSVAAALVLLIKLPRRLLLRLLWVDIWVDIAITLMFVMLFAGTYSGMMAAIVAGLAFSIVLGLAKLFMGYERPIYNRKHKRLYWIKVQGKWTS